MTVSVLAEGITDLQRYLDLAPAVTRQAARLAINDTASRKGITAIRDLMQEQVAFPRGYLAGDRLGVTQWATEERLQAAITGRERPTSLARFAISGSPSTPKAPVILRVNPASREKMARAFLIRLRGAEDSYNLGLAIRLRPGEVLANKNVMAKKMGQGGLYLLYGPSVDQVFRTVAVDASPIIADELASQFIRQFDRLSR